ncbi:MAG: imidazoleglycerol-phosphate dehydratase HisB [Ruminococcus sp.]|jgi:imidazoleglycerol-phosphate dehydratase|nr:imidazoleglycerol-phosphate dehydratase HisB [Ruminococcus sp.]
MRTFEIDRKTKETDVSVKINLDNPKYKINTGIGFFDHMLTALSVHSGIGLEISSIGDLEVDGHHTVEDVGIVLGLALKNALANKPVARYGFASVPMDESLATTTLDISGRAYLVFNAEFENEKIGDFATELTEEFFRAFAFNAGITLHINLLYGKNDHHKVEAVFKSFAYALKNAVKESDVLISSKGIL